ncbi:hypothetical protein HDU98_011399 [Podochytrium sp. JEL0797]|nr:hypothetical protein HDU98_011399 [Podochytrium sp. JEL0797]
MDPSVDTKQHVSTDHTDHTDTLVAVKPGQTKAVSSNLADSLAGAVPGAVPSTTTPASMEAVVPTAAEAHGEKRDAKDAGEKGHEKDAGANKATTPPDSDGESHVVSDSAEGEAGGYLDEDADNEPSDAGDNDDAAPQLRVRPKHSQGADFELVSADEDSDDDADAEEESESATSEDEDSDEETSDEGSVSAGGLRMRHKHAKSQDSLSQNEQESDEATIKELRLPEPQNLMEEVWHSVFTPGINSKVVRVMDACFYALFATLFGLLVVSGGSVHVVVLLLVAICLFVTVKWFVAELNKANAEIAAKEAEEHKDTPAVESDAAVPATISTNADIPTTTSTNADAEPPSVNAKPTSASNASATPSDEAAALLPHESKKDQ